MRQSELQREVTNRKRELNWRGADAVLHDREKLSPLRHVGIEAQMYAENAA